MTTSPSQTSDLVTTHSPSTTAPSSGTSSVNSTRIRLCGKWKREWYPVVTKRVLLQRFGAGERAPPHRGRGRRAPECAGDMGARVDALRCDAACPTRPIPPLAVPVGGAREVAIRSTGEGSRYPRDSVAAVTRTATERTRCGLRRVLSRAISRRRMRGRGRDGCLCSVVCNGAREKGTG